MSEIEFALGQILWYFSNLKAYLLVTETQIVITTTKIQHS